YPPNVRTVQYYVRKFRKVQISPKLSGPVRYPPNVSGQYRYPKMSEQIKISPKCQTIQYPPQNSGHK
ncbi:unnamed protein product, partial [Staurois parvus]